MKPLWTVVALRDDYPDGTCWAWMEGSERVCGAPADDGHLCSRHVRMATRRRDVAAKKAFLAHEKAFAENLRREPARRVELAMIEARIARLDRTPTTDPAAVNLPLSRRLPSDAAIHELALLVTRRDTLRRQVGER